MRSRGLLIALLIASLLCLGGCWDRTEVDDLAFITAIGLDRGTDKPLLVTVAVAVVRGLSAGVRGGTQAPGTSRRLVVAEGDTILEAVHVLNAAAVRQLTLRHARSIVVGEGLARQGLATVLAEIQTNPEMRETTALILARGRAHDVLAAAEPITELNPAKAEEGLMLQAKRFHLAPPIRFQHFLNRLYVGGIDPFLEVLAINPTVASGATEPVATTASALAGQLPRAGGNPVEQAGTALFRRDRLAGFLNIDETQMLLALRGEMGKAYITLPDPQTPGRSISLRFHQENVPQYRTDFVNNRPKAEVELLFDGELLAAPQGDKYTTGNGRRQLEAAAARFAEGVARDVVRKALDWGSDPVGFGLQFRSKFPSLAAFEAYRWPDHIRQLDVTVHATMRIRRYGLTLPGEWWLQK